jgi:hypothetical protein
MPVAIARVISVGATGDADKRNQQQNHREGVRPTHHIDPPPLPPPDWPYIGPLWSLGGG